MNISDLHRLPRNQKIAGIVATIAALPFAIWLRAHAIVMLWLWFAVPLGAPEIGLAHALGIVTLLAVIRSKDVADQDDAFTGKTIFGVPAKLWAGVGTSGVSLLFGWALWGLM